ncbi:MAG TPA: hypothetical protein VFB45_25160 [Pseudolabrys sp.]|nr:hypothetical protein [Pseudolabrys sp.]
MITELAVRTQALRDCSRLEQKFPSTKFHSMEIFEYRACMTEHGQVE